MLHRASGLPTAVPTTTTGAYYSTIIALYNLISPRLDGKACFFRVVVRFICKICIFLFYIIFYFLGRRVARGAGVESLGYIVC